jgi:hypothetical protein
MEKILLLSLLVANVALPLAFATDPEPNRGLRRTVSTILLYNCVYLLALIFIYPQLAD